MGSTIGTLAGMATGVPGLGLGLGALGTLADVQALNAELGMMGLPQDIAFGPAFASNVTSGFFGTPAATQFGNALGFEAFAEAPLSAFAAPVGGQASQAAPAGMTEADAMAAGMQSPGFGTGSYGFGTSPTQGGSGNFGAMSATERGETVGPPGSDAYGAAAAAAAAQAQANVDAANIDADAQPGGVNDGPGGPGGPGGSTDSAADSPGAGGGVGADGGVGSGGDAWKEGGIVKLAGGGLAELLEEDMSPRTAREYFQELIRADAERNLQGLPEISGFAQYDRNRGVTVMPYGARIRTEVPMAEDGGMLDLGAGYQGVNVSGRGFRQNRNLLREAGAGYTFPDGGRLSLDYFDRMASEGGDTGPSGDLHQDVRSPSEAEMMGRSVPSRGARLGYRREFAAGGLVPLAGGGKIAIGPGGGLDDLIPTSINGRRAAALSDGEFVIPADVVSMMGDGSSNAGARRLYDLVKQVRDVKTGTTKQAGPLPVGDILKRSMGR